jgi:hypothetical protein
LSDELYIDGVDVAVLVDDVVADLLNVEERHWIRYKSATPAQWRRGVEVSRRYYAKVIGPE